jgi:hypothetical protein
MNFLPWALALGVFVGNWLVVPFFIKRRPYKDGFFIGVLAAIFSLIFYAFFDFVF